MFANTQQSAAVLSEVLLVHSATMLACNNAHMRLLYGVISPTASVDALSINEETLRKC